MHRDLLWDSRYAPGSLTGVLCPETLQTPHAPGCAGVSHWRPLPGNPADSPCAGRRGDCCGRTAGPAWWGVASACASADAWKPSCGGRVCWHLHHTEAASSSISTARHDAYRVFPATRMRHMQAPHASAYCRTVRLWAGTRACKWVRAGRMQAGILGWLSD